MIENVWLPFTTEEVPTRSFSQWYSRAFPVNDAQKELKTHGSKVEDRIYTVYSSFVEIGGEIEKAMAAQKNVNAINQKIDQETKKNIPASDELMSIAGPEIQTIADYCEFR